jgi:hypothetical protein
MVYKSKYSIYVLGSDLTWLTISNGDKVNIKVAVLDKIYNFAVNSNHFHLILFWVLNIQYKFRKCVVKRIASAIQSNVLCSLVGMCARQDTSVEVSSLFSIFLSYITGPKLAVIVYYRVVIEKEIAMEFTTDELLLMTSMQFRCTEQNLIETC